MDAAARSLPADSLQHGRVLDSLGHRILAVHCGEIMAVQRKASDYIVRPNIAGRDAERIMAVFRSADLIANICHKFFVPAGGKQADHRGRRGTSRRWAAGLLSQLGTRMRISP